MWPLFFSTCQDSALAEQSEILHNERKAARWLNMKKCFFSCHLWKSPLRWRTIVKIKHRWSLWRWNRKPSQSQFHMGTVFVRLSWDSLCIFIMRGGGKVSAETQLLRSNFSAVTSFPPVCRCMSGNTCPMSCLELLRGQHLLIQLASLMKYSLLLTSARG